jgi:hypothetical protein
MSCTLTPSQLRLWATTTGKPKCMEAAGASDAHVLPGLAVGDVADILQKNQNIKQVGTMLLHASTYLQLG